MNCLSSGIHLSIKCYQLTCKIQYICLYQKERFPGAITGMHFLMTFSFFLYKSIPCIYGQCFVSTSCFFYSHVHEVSTVYDYNLYLMYNFVFKEKSKETGNLNISIFIICYFIYTCIQYTLSKLSNLYIHVFHKQSIFYKLFLSHSLFLENAFKMYLICTFVYDLISNKRLLVYIT